MVHRKRSLTCYASHFPPFVTSPELEESSFSRSGPARREQRRLTHSSVLHTLTTDTGSRLYVCPRQVSPRVAFFTWTETRGRWRSTIKARHGRAEISDTSRPRHLANSFRSGCCRWGSPPWSWRTSRSNRRVGSDELAPTKNLRPFETAIAHRQRLRFPTFFLAPQLSADHEDARRHELSAALPDHKTLTAPNFVTKCAQNLSRRNNPTVQLQTECQSLQLFTKLSRAAGVRQP